MAWQDRIRPAAYTSPGGTRIEFTYENVDRSVELRGAHFNFIDNEGTFIQGTGSSGRSFPMNVIITGNDYDLTADRFFEALREPGTGSLEHPAYGRIDVVPLGRVIQRDDLKTAGNQAIFNVVFWETIPTLYPLGIFDLISQVLNSISGFNISIASEFAGRIDLATKFGAITAIQRVISQINQVRSSVANIVSESEEVFDRASDIYDSITSSINSLIDTPETLASQISQYIQVGAESPVGWPERIEAYGAASRTIFAQQTYTKSNDSVQLNSFIVDDLSASNLIISVVLSATRTKFETRPQAIEAAQDLLTLAGELNTWREDNFKSLDITDTGEAYQKWQEAVALAVGFLVDLSFTLAQERIITLDRPRSIIDLAAELYGTVDDHLDFLITTNSLTGDEIITELPIGKKIKYYA